MPRDCPNIDCPMDATGHCHRCDPPRVAILTPAEAAHFGTLRNSSPNMLTDEMAAYDRQFPQK